MAADQPFDPSILLAPDGRRIDFDVDEPLELECVLLTPGDVAALAGVTLSLDDCSVEGCDLSLFSFVSIKNSRFIGSKLQGTSFARLVDNVVFERCALRECAFRMMTLKRTSFVESGLTGCDFYGSTLDRVEFRGAPLAGVGFDKCSIDQVDLTGVTDLAIGDPMTMRGARITEAQAFSIAHRLADQVGIIVEDGPSEAGDLADG